MSGLMPPGKVPIQSTAGAVPIRNEKGDIAMEKVKVSRYVSGKRPDYAPDSSEEEDEEELEVGFHRQKRVGDLMDLIESAKDVDDRRLRRLQERQEEDDESGSDAEARIMRHRRLVEPELMDDDSEDEQRRRRPDLESDEASEEEEELNEEEIERRREMLRRKVQEAKVDEELLDVEDEKELSDEDEDKDESSEYEEYSDSEGEEVQPRMKPVFVRKKDRVTIQEKEKESQRQRDLDIESRRLANERRHQTLQMVEAAIRRDIEEERKNRKDDEDNFEAVNTDDENDEAEYEAWKVRELRRLKRDRDERENLEKEKIEVEKLRNMTEDERKQELKLNPKVVTNRAQKGKYKFLQKYYHRGAFFLDQEDQVYRRDFSAPTLEDHFDKTVLPKVMQVKNFGRSGRTKYTHLVDQDTTQFDSAWVTDTAASLKFHNSKGGGLKQSFDRPSGKKRK